MARVSENIMKISTSKHAHTVSRLKPGLSFRAFHFYFPSDCVCVRMYLTTSLHEQGVRQIHFFRWELADLNSEFSFS